jgi:hypothetical protein
MLVEEIGALRDFVLDNLYMGGQDALFGMGFWMCSIVDRRIGAAVDGQTRMDSAWILHGFCIDSATTNRSGRSPTLVTLLTQSLLGQVIFRKDSCLSCAFLEVVLVLADH